MKQLSIIALFLLSILTGASHADQPNIVIVLADDMGYGDAGCYNQNSKCPTPHIDALAKSGMRFTDAHSTGAWCTPSRYGLLTGRYAFRTSLLWREAPVIAQGVETTADVLRRSGYTTAMVGKWHLGFENASNLDFASDIRGGPCDRGFDTYFGLPASLDIPDYYWIRNRRVTAPPTVPIADGQSDPNVWSSVQGKFWRGGKRGKDFDMEDVLDRIGREAVERVTTLSKVDQPFFLYVPLTSPHTPWLPGPKFAAANKAGIYSQFVAHTDAILGRIVAAIQDCGQRDNTLIVFTSDNGPVWYRSNTEEYGHDSMGGLRGMKGDVWEAGHRIPFIVSWPGHVPPSTTNDQLISFIDVHATLAAIAGTEKSATAVDSLNFADVWLGKSDENVRSELICFQDPISLRRGKWKFINRLGSAGFLAHQSKGDAFIAKDGLNPSLENANAPRGQLYDLDADPSESTNLWTSKPSLVRQMNARLEELSE